MLACPTDEWMVLERFARTALSILAMMMCLSHGLDARIRGAWRVVGLGVCKVGQVLLLIWVR